MAVKLVGAERKLKDGRVVRAKYDAPDGGGKGKFVGWETIRTEKSDERQTKKSDQKSEGSERRTSENSDRQSDKSDGTSAWGVFAGLALAAALAGGAWAAVRALRHRREGSSSDGGLQLLQGGAQASG